MIKRTIVVLALLFVFMGVGFKGKYVSSAPQGVYRYEYKEVRIPRDAELIYELNKIGSGGWQLVNVRGIRYIFMRGHLVVPETEEEPQLW